MNILKSFNMIVLRNSVILLHFKLYFIHKNFLFLTYFLLIFYSQHTAFQQIINHTNTHFLKAR